MLERVGSNAKTTLSERRQFSDVPADSLLLRELWFNTRFRGFPLLQKWFSFLLNSKYVNPLERSILAHEPKSNVSFADYIGGAALIFMGSCVHGLRRSCHGCGDGCPLSFR